MQWLVKLKSRVSGLGKTIGGGLAGSGKKLLRPVSFPPARAAHHESRPFSPHELESMGAARYILHWQIP